MVDARYDLELARLALFAQEFIICHEARAGYDGDDLTPELVLVGRITAQCAAVYNLAPPGGMLDPGSWFTGAKES
jgi:hypothetical protein